MAIDVQMVRIPRINANLTAIPGITVDLGARIVAPANVETYDGEYDVTPLPYDPITLGTRHKFMEENVTVEKIPYYETSNVYGITAYIGSEV